MTENKTEVIAGKSRTVCINELSAVSKIDSMGLGVQVGVFKTIKANNGEILLQGMAERIKRLLKIMDLNSEVKGGR